MSQTVVYKSKSGFVLPVSATIGALQFEIETDMSLVNTRSKDFIINVADIPNKPEKGDKIDALGTTFEVLPFGDEPHWIYANAYRDSYRIHTKEVKA